MARFSYRAVLFDLFGTLVEDVQASVHQRMAGLLGLPTERFLEYWSPGYEARGKGQKTFEECLIEMSAVLKLPLDRTVIQAIANVRVEELAKHLRMVKPGAESLLADLKEQRIPYALISNASIEVHAGWSGSPVAAWFPLPIFSCDVRLMKPDAAIYRLGCEQLGLESEECVFVGDGGDNELAGAAAVGLTPVQVGNQRLPIADAHYRVRSLNDIASLLGLARGFSYG